MKRKLMVSLSPPLAFYAVAALLMMVTSVAFGVPVEDKRAMIGGLKEGMPAARAGLQGGDEIVAIDGAPVEISDVARAINRGGDLVSVEVIRGGEHRNFSVAPIRDGDMRRIGIEIMPAEGFHDAPFFRSVWEGVAFPARYGAFVLHGFYEIFAGRQKAEFSGPIGIVKVMHKQTSRGLRYGLTTIAILFAYLMVLSLLAAPIVFWRAAPNRS
jgi:regulator of sigma E protease